MWWCDGVEVLIGEEVGVYEGNGRYIYYYFNVSSLSIGHVHDAHHK